MTAESTAQFLGRREQELIAQIKALKGQLAPLEAELSQVQNMRSFLPGGTNNPLPSAGAPAPIVDSAPQALARYSEMTIKELAIQALLDAFPHGGSAAQIRDFIQKAYRRDIEAGSLRTQLHRLKSDRILNYSEDTWSLTNDARRRFSMYDHPSSRKAMAELKDDPEERLPTRRR